MSQALHPAILARPIGAIGGAPALFLRPAAIPEPVAGTRRTKIWEFSTNLHCSIVGTCLSTAELRQILGKLGLAPSGATDHELHHIAVSTAGRHDQAAKLLNKALDTRHKLAIAQFGKARDEAELRGLWRDAVKRGDIPGAYWATLTHHLTCQALVREAFGEVHMLSHLVGAANRADIRRLRELEEEKAALEERLARQQTAFHDAVVHRDADIQGLRQALSRRIAAEPAAVPHAEEFDTLHRLVGDLERRLSAETKRRRTAEAKLTDAQDALAVERSARLAAETEAQACREELQLFEAGLQPAQGESSVRLDGTTILYVGGRPPQIAHLRQLGEERGATLLHHDGGIEHHSALLPELTRRADIVLFPVDCISHDAAWTVKRVCRQTGKRFIPLRSAGATTFLAALHGLTP